MYRFTFRNVILPINWFILNGFGEDVRFAGIFKLTSKFVKFDALIFFTKLFLLKYIFNIASIKDTFTVPENAGVVALYAGTIPATDIPNGTVTVYSYAALLIVLLIIN